MTMLIYLLCGLLINTLCTYVLARQEYKGEKIGINSILYLIFGIVVLSPIWPLAAVCTFQEITKK